MCENSQVEIKPRFLGKPEAACASKAKPGIHLLVPISRQDPLPGKQSPCGVRHFLSVWSSYPGWVPSHLLVHPLLAGQCEELKSPWLWVTTALQQLEHWCDIRIILIKNTKHSIMQTSTKKISSIPVRTIKLPCPDWAVTWALWIDFPENGESFWKEHRQYGVQKEGTHTLGISYKNVLQIWWPLTCCMGLVLLTLWMSTIFDMLDIWYWLYCECVIWNNYTFGS